MTGFRLLAALSVLVLLAPSVSAGETVRVSGTGGAIGGLKLLGVAFEKRNPGVRVKVFPSTGSAGGIKAVAAGKLDLAVSSRRVRDDEKVPGLVEAPYVKTPFLFATAVSNPAEGIRLSEIRDIYAGKKTTWPDGRRISLVLRPATDAFTGYIENISPEMKAAVAAAQNRSDLFIGITDQDAADQIERTAGSFGVTSYALVVSEKRDIKPLAVDGISPVVKGGINGKYPYFATSYLVYRNGGNIGAAGRFIDFIHSRDGEKILGSIGAIPLRNTQGKP